ncbi:zinc finger protein 85-like isoform X3 [Bicyclus anynana]|uniref:Zinc finger protein 85-like isoform X3 n=1 Tax=Bicyclus anynana TaxID=110368 RepID=A0ABM3M3I5_BICAN|nr:zinc finger protein 85-like isoform X3 [Bicyclus anynana]
MTNHTTKDLKCNFTQTTGADQCDLYIHPTDEEEQTAADESVVGNVATVVVKNEYCTDFMLSVDKLELLHEDDNHIDNLNNDWESDLSIKLEARPLVEAGSEDHHNKAAAAFNTQNLIKSENITFGCTLCYEDFVQEDAYNEHMIMHLQDAACDASPVCEPRAAVSRSWDSLVLQNKTGSRRLNDAPPPAAGCAQATVAPLSARLAANDYKVQATEDAAATWKSEQILETDIGELDNQLSQSNTNISCMDDINRFTNCVVQSCDIFNKPERTVLDEDPRVNTRTGTKPYSCETCNYKSARKSDLKRHERTHTGEKPYSCETCTYKTAEKIAPLSARLAANDYKVQATEEAAATWKSEQILETDIGEDNQLSQSNTNTLFAPLSARLAANDYKVQAIEEAAATWKSEQILETDIGELDNQLYDINRFTNSVVQLYYDTYKKHETTVLNENTRVKTHTGAKPYSCETCNYKCAHKSTLINHKRTHTGAKPYSCEICNYKCAQKGGLNRHERIHTGEKPYSCETCNYKCAHKSTLINHKRTHTGEKPYSCETCNFKCAHKSSLINHKRTHTDEKPYSCEACDYKCARKSYLNSHKRTYTH